MKRQTRFGEHKHMIFGRFKRCLHPVQRFQSDSERVLSIMLDRESKSRSSLHAASSKSFTSGARPNANISPISSRKQMARSTWLKPKCARTSKTPKSLRRKTLLFLGANTRPIVRRRIAEKSWKYLLVAHGVIVEDMTLKGLEAQAVVEL
jgi:type III restriction enzyme